MTLTLIHDGCAHVTLNPKNVNQAFKVLSENYFVRSVRSWSDSAAHGAGATKNKGHPKLHVVLQGPPGIAMSREDYLDAVSVLESFIPEFG